MRAPLERLPPEVFHIIATTFLAADFGAVRLTSRSLHHLSLAPFTKQHFTTVGTTLGSHFLARLVKISRHPCFSRALTTLDIILLTSADYTTLSSIRRIGLYPPPLRFPRIPGFAPHQIAAESTLFADVSSAAYPRCIVVPLTTALKALPNLHTLRFRSRSSEPSNRTSLLASQDDGVFRARCFSAVMDALVQSGIQLREFGMAKGEKKRAVRVSRGANIPYQYLHLSPSALETMQHRFKKLEALTLSVTMMDIETRPDDWPKTVTNFIACAPNLRHLALSLDHPAEIRPETTLIVNALAKSCWLPQLESLHLTNASLHFDGLVVLISTHARTLTQITLADICIVAGTWPAFLTYLKKVENLAMLRLSGLQVIGHDDEEINGPIMFGRKKKKKKGKVTVKLDTLCGKRMAELLDELGADGQNGGSSMTADVWAPQGLTS